VTYTGPVDTSALGLLRVEDGMDEEDSGAAGEASSDGTGSIIRSDDTTTITRLNPHIFFLLLHEQRSCGT